ncbi:MAG: hypothetical protein RLY86_3995 [Pseudomonadota bacterium]|jgi:hypothetical protein
MSERKPVEGVQPAEGPPLLRPPERAAVEARARAIREEGEPQPPPPPPPVEPSPAYRPYRVQLDPETSRLFTDVLDPRTGGVLLRIPPGYAPSEAAESRAGDADAPRETRA